MAGGMLIHLPSLFDVVHMKGRKECVLYYSFLPAACLVLNLYGVGTSQIRSLPSRIDSPRLALDPPDP